jgi:hypothetical protein
MAVVCPNLICDVRKIIEKSSDVGIAIGVKFGIAFILLLILNSYARALKFTIYFVDESKIPPPYLLCLG